jgi:hypothetical protein
MFKKYPQLLELYREKVGEYLYEDINPRRLIVKASKGK